MNKDSIHNTLKFLKLGVPLDDKHNYAIRGWKKWVWFSTLYVWRTFLFFFFIYLIAKIIY